MSTKKYVKPVTRDLGAVSAAEGFCVTGGTAYGSTCSNGPNDQDTCTTGGLAITNPPQQLCNSGGFAANCFSGAAAGG